MDINLLKTFLEVYRTRHFSRAAENLFLTQSAVSARIRLLEENLGVSLFDRKRKDMQLTPAGRRFLKHAEQLVQAWNRACWETAQAEEVREFLAVGAVPGIWETLAGGWLMQISGCKPELSLVAEADGAEALLRKLIDGILDVVFLFDPPQMEDFGNQQIHQISLVLLATRPDLSCVQALDHRYVMVDWGASFEAQHARYFADMPLPRLRVGLVRIALEYILAREGAAYLPKSLVADLVQQEKLFPVAEAPEMERQISAVYAYTNTRLPLIEEVLGFRPVK